MHLSTFPIAGWNFRQTLAFFELNAHEPATLEAEPDNKYDEYAIRVLLGNEHCGYIPRYMSQILLSMGLEKFEVKFEGLEPNIKNKLEPWIQLFLLD